MQLTITTQERIKADADKVTTEINDKLRKRVNDFDRRTTYVDGYHTGYIAGATAENSRAQPLADLLEMIKTLGPVDSLTVKLIDKKLQQWKDGKEPILTEERAFEKWKKENVTELGEFDFLVGSKRVHSKKELRRIYDYLTNPPK